jgi:hypothetical protein
MALIPCQVSFNMKKTTHSIYAEKKIEQGRRKGKEEERIKRESNEKKIML